jgi:hypothetical protein
MAASVPITAKVTIAGQATARPRVTCIFSAVITGRGISITISPGHNIISKATTSQGTTKAATGRAGAPTEVGKFIAAEARTGLTLVVREIYHNRVILHVFYIPQDDDSAGSQTRNLTRVTNGTRFS